MLYLADARCIGSQSLGLVEFKKSAIFFENPLRLQVSLGLVEFKKSAILQRISFLPRSLLGLVEFKKSAIF